MSKLLVRPTRLRAGEDVRYCTVNGHYQLFTAPGSGVSPIAVPASQRLGFNRDGLRNKSGETAGRARGQARERGHTLARLDESNRLNGCRCPPPTPSRNEAPEPKVRQERQGMNDDYP